MSTKTHLVIVQGGEQTQIPLKVLRCFGGINDVPVHVISNESNSILHFSRYAKSFDYCPNLLNLSAFLETIEAITQKYGKMVVMPTLVEDIRFVAEHKADIEAITPVVDLPTPLSFDTVNDKWLLAQFLEQHNLSSPKTILCTTEPQFEEQLHDLKFPVLCKPINGRSGIGIVKFDTDYELLDFVNNKDNKVSEKYIVQEYIHGYDIDCSVLCHEGQILADTIQKGIAYTDEPYSPAFGIALLENEAVLNLVEKVVAELGWSGVGHLDLRYDAEDQTVKVLEFNPRYWLSLTGSLLAGVNFPYLAYRAALGEHFSIPEYKKSIFISYKNYMQKNLRAYRRENPGEYGLRQTDLGQALKDPLPDFLKGVKYVTKGVLEKLGMHM